MTKLNNLDIYVTGKCNYACDYCFGEDDRCGSMAPDVYRAALEFGRFLAVGRIGLCGGEPLVCPEFEEFALAARNQGFRLILRTNGMLIGKHLEFIAENCEWVGISLDGLPGINALMRKSRAPVPADEQFSRPVEAIFSLKRLNPDLKILLATLASKKNYQHIRALGDYIISAQAPIDKWKIYEFIPDKFRSGSNSQEFAMTPQEFDDMARQLPDTINGAPILLQSARQERAAANCLIVYQNGDIRLMGKKYGNVAKDRFSDIIDGLERYNALTAVNANKALTYNAQ